MRVTQPGTSSPAVAVAPAHRKLRTLRVAGAVTALAALFGPVVPAAATDTQPASARTTVTLRIAGCTGCVVAVYNTALPGFRGRPLHNVSVRGGVARFSVRTVATRGLAFSFADTGPYTTPGYRPNVAMDVHGVATGALVSEGRAKATSGARRCWAGTRRAAVTLRVRTFTFRVRDLTRKHKFVTSAAFWVSPNRAGFGRETTFRHLPRFPGIAQLGDQDAPFCN